jgi:phosphatidylglycerophosphatase A
MENSNMRKFVIQSASLFGVGYISKAPGTWGTLVTLPFCYLLMHLGSIMYMVITLFLTIYAIWAADLYERQSDLHDAKQIVIDESVGILITFVMLPITWQTFVAGFVAFRLLDIVKPFPISYFDKKVPGGLGVVADDVVAGLLGNIALQFVYTQTSWLGIRLYN